MNWHLQIQMNEKLFLRDPTKSDLGHRIVRKGAVMMEQLGYEEFTFKKLATEIATNESSVYRYFENKHRLLLYLVGWYWRWLEYLVVVHTNNLKTPEEKVDVIIRILLLQVNGELTLEGLEVEKRVLHQLVIKESSKVYLTNHVEEDNKNLFFKPYKDLTGRIAAIFHDINPTYKYTRSLTSTMIEMAHYQYFFMKNLPSLTDFGLLKDERDVYHYLKGLVLAALRAAV
jgi:AcrR family transcriptional regulator